MERFLLVLFSLVGFLLVFAFQEKMRSGENPPRRLAKIRVQVDENRRSPQEPPEEDEFTSSRFFTWLVLAVILFFFLMLLAK